jgi:hypothetical protein
MTTYAQLASDIASYSHRTDLTTGQISTFVALAEAKIGRVLRVRQQETALASTAIGAANTIALPADWVATKVLYAANYQSTPLLPQTYELVLARDGQSGVPQFYAVANGSWFFDGSGDVVGVYYAAIPSLETNSTNWLATAAPDVYLFFALAEQALFAYDDKRAAIWTGRASAALLEVQLSDKRDRFTGQLQSVKRY